MLESIIASHLQTCVGWLTSSSAATWIRSGGDSLCCVVVVVACHNFCGHDALALVVLLLELVGLMTLMIRTITMTTRTRGESIVHVDKSQHA